MKKKLKSDLISLAHRILKMGPEPDYASLQHEAKKLYDLLTVLSFTEAHFEGTNPTISKAEIIKALQQKNEEQVEEIVEEATVSTEQPVETTAPAEQMKDLPQEPVLRLETDVDRVNAIAKANEELFKRIQEEKERSKKFERSPEKPRPKEPETNQQTLYEPVIEKIKDMVAQMPPEADDIDEMVAKLTAFPSETSKDDVEQYGRIAEFETPKPAAKKKPATSKKAPAKSRLNIGLNDKLAFIKHLFNGSQTDYNRIISQLNTQASAAEALHFINTMVKPDYNHWEGKELYETRFTQLVERQLER